MSLCAYRPGANQRRKFKQRGLVSLYLVFILTILSQIFYPLTHENNLAYLTIATVYLGATCMLLHAYYSYGIRYLVTLFLVTYLFAFLIELLGSKTGWPFGKYSYDTSLGFNISGVPVLVPLAWIMMTHPALIAARKVSMNWTFLYGGALLVAWDLFLDPQMVSAGRWRWETPNPHLPFSSQVPISNSFGWLLAGITLIALLNLLLPRDRKKNGINSNVPDLFLLWTLFSGVVGNVFFFHKPGVGIFAGVIFAAILAPYVYISLLGKPDKVS